MSVIFLTLVLAEALVQLSGVLDFPVYKADNQIGYIPAPGQSGKFLNSREWEFNAYSMSAGTFKPDGSRFNVLLVGDSIVLGGNPMAQSERLRPQLENSPTGKYGRFLLAAGHCRTNCHTFVAIKK